MDRYKSLKDHVYDYITDQIQQGKLSAGDRVPEQSICNELGVSRTPVREALISLVGDGYLDNEPRKGFRVHGFTLEDAREVFQIIGPLDAQAAFLACDTLTAEQLNQMEFLVGAMDLAIESELMDRYDDLQREFHQIYWQTCGNQRLVEIINLQSIHFHKKAYNLSNLENAKKLMIKANMEHGTICSLFREKDKHKLRDYIIDVHWNIQNAYFASWN